MESDSFPLQLALATGYEEKETTRVSVPTNTQLLTQ